VTCNRRFVYSRLVEAQRDNCVNSPAILRRSATTMVVLRWKETAIPSTIALPERSKKEALHFPPAELVVIRKP
jgi:hypothetical protein